MDAYHLAKLNAMNFKSLIAESENLLESFFHTNTLRDPESEFNSIHFGIKINKFLRPKKFLDH